MTRVALSYRRDDSAAITGRIFDRLVAHYGGNSVFRDVDNIPLGVDFREHINTVLAQTDVTLVVVGKRWFGPLPRRRRRIDDPADPVRVEVETALRNGMPVVPILVEGGAMPNADQLPDGLKEFVYRNGLEVDSGRDFDQHIERLIRNLEPILARRAKEQAEATQRAEEERQQGEAARQVAEEKQRDEEERRRAEAARLAAEEKQRAEAARLAEDEKQRVETARLAENEKQRAETARRAEEERRRAEAARQAADEKQRAEAAQLAAEEKQRAELARQAEEEKRQAEAVRKAEEDNRRAEAARQAEEERRWTEAAREVARQFAKEKDVYVEPNIPPSKKANAMAAAQVPAEHTLFILFDYTLSGSAKDCLVATQSGIFYNNQFIKPYASAYGEINIL